MHRSRVIGLVGLLSSVLGSISPAWSQDRAQISIVEAGPATVAPGAPMNFRFRVTNTGGTTWSPVYTSSSCLSFVSLSAMTSCTQAAGYRSGQYYLYAVAFKLDSAAPYDANNGGNALAPLPGPVSPGQTVDIQVTISAPIQTGRYALSPWMGQGSYNFTSVVLNSGQQGYETAPKFDFQVSNQTSDPGSTSTLRLVSGTIAGQSVSPSSRVVTVQPGASLSGSFTVQINSTFASNAVMAMGITPTWGDPATSFSDLGGFSTPVSGLSRTVNVNYTAPTTPGTYHIIAAFHGEFEASSVMSCTNWSAGSPVWNDGNDIAAWSQSIIDTANSNGNVRVNYRYTNGMQLLYVPATGIRVVVQGSSPPPSSGGVSLGISSVSARAGGSVDVPVLLAATSGSPASLQFDVAFESQKINYNSARRGEQLVGAGKELTTQTLSGGSLRVVGAGLNQNTIGNGPVAYLNFSLTSGFSSGETTINLTNCLASDAQGRSMSASCGSGKITVQTGCGCDVNGDGASNVADVQLIINQVLGVVTASCDVNGDGVVNIADVQKVINAVLGLGCN